MSLRTTRYHARYRPEPIGRKRPAGIWVMFDLLGNAVGYYVGRGGSSLDPVAVVGATGHGGLTTTPRDYAKARAIAADSRRAGRYADRDAEKCFDLREYQLRGVRAGLPRFVTSTVFRPADAHGRPIDDDTFEGLTLQRVKFSTEKHSEIAALTATRCGGAIPWLRRPANEKAAHRIDRSLPRLDASGANGTDQAAA